MKKYVIVLVLPLIIATLSACSEGTADNKAASTSSKTTTVSENQPQAPAETTVKPAQTYTLQDIAAHNTAADCWFAINGKVYGVSSFIAKHPGGEAILKGCGLDATEMFEGIPHSEKAVGLLENYYLGDLGDLKN